MYLQAERSIWGKLAKKLYGTVSHQLQQRMYVAWRRRRAGSIRDRVLLSLESEGFTCRVPALANTSESQHEVDRLTTADVKNHTDGLVRNCYSFTNSENDSLICRSEKRVRNCDVGRNHHRVIVTRFMRKNNTNFIHIRHKSTVSSFSLKGMYMYDCVFLS